MLFLTFKSPGRSSSVGPVAAIEFRGDEVCVGGATIPIGRYSVGHWTHANERWTYAECRTRIWIRFEDHDGKLGLVIGPRPSLRLRDRWLFAGRERLATLVPGKAQWLAAGRDEGWPVVRVIPHQTSDKP